MTMSQNESGRKLLEKAYMLESPEDNISYYDKLADSYDQDFADGLGYALPQAVAQTFRAISTGTDSPVIDVGCGTGLLADALDSPNLHIDGLDISDAMLRLAYEKKRYRKFYKVDLTKPLDSNIYDYGAVLSCGTFTHGHLGPDALVSLLDVAKKSALFILSINHEHYCKRGFEAVINTLVEENKIIDPKCNELNIYNVAGHEHSDDLGVIVSFRKV